MRVRNLLPQISDLRQQWERSDPSAVFASGICCRRFLTADSGACRDRTGDFRVANAALSQLELTPRVEGQARVEERGAGRDRRPALLLRADAEAEVRDRVRRGGGKTQRQPAALPGPAAVVFQFRWRRVAGSRQLRRVGRRWASSPRLEGVQSTGCESIAAGRRAPLSVNFSGTTIPPGRGRPRRPRADRRREAAEGRRGAARRAGRTPRCRRCGCSSCPGSAQKPRPRLAKPRQISQWLAPPVSARSAARMASRPSTNPGWHGWNFMPVHHELQREVVPARRPVP